MTTSTHAKDISAIREDVIKLKMRISELVDELESTKRELLDFKKRAHRDVTVLTETTRELQRNQLSSVR